MNIFIQKSPKETPSKDGEYFIAYKDYEHTVMATSEWTKEFGWSHGAKDDMIYWIQPFESKEEIDKYDFQRILDDTLQGGFGESAGLVNYKEEAAQDCYKLSIEMALQLMCDNNLAIEFVQWLRENDWQCSRENPDCFDRRAGNLLHGRILETKTTQELFKLFIQSK